MIHDYITARFSKSNASRQQLHLQLLDAYRTKAPGGWASGPNDGYFFQYVAYHLFQVRDCATLYAIAQDSLFLATQELAVPSDPQIALRTIETALDLASASDDAVSMAKFTFEYSYRMAQRRSESPLTALRKGKFDRAIKLATLLPPEDSVLAQLLLLWEILDVGETHRANQVVQGLLSRTLPTLFNAGGIAANLLVLISDVDSSVVVPLAGKLLGHNDLLHIVDDLCYRNKWELAYECAELLRQYSPDNACICTRKTAMACVKAGNLEAARGRLGNMGFSDRAKVLGAIATAEVELGEHERARKSLDWMRYASQTANIGYVVTRAWATTALCEASLGDKDAATFAIRKAEETARSLTAGKLQGEMLCEVASARAKLGDSTEAKTILETAVRQLELETDRFKHCEFVFEITKILIECNDFERASHFVDRLTEWDDKVRLLSLIATTLMDRARLDDARTVLSRAIGLVPESSGDLTDWTISQLSDALLRIEHYDSAAAVVNTLGNPYWRVPQLCKVFSTAVKAERMDDASSALALAYENAVACSTERGTQMLCHVSGTLAHCGRVSDALFLARRISPAKGRSAAYMSIGYAMARAGDGRGARTAIQYALQCSLDAPYYFEGEALAPIAISLAQRNQHDLATQVVDQIDSLYFRTDTLLKMSRLCARDQALKYLYSATRDAQKEKPPQRRTRLEQIADRFVELKCIERSLEFLPDLTPEFLASVTRNYGITVAQSLCALVVTNEERRKCFVAVLNELRQPPCADNARVRMNSPNDVGQFIRDTKEYSRSFPLSDYLLVLCDIAMTQYHRGLCSEASQTLDEALLHLERFEQDNDKRFTHDVVNDLVVRLNKSLAVTGRISEALSLRYRTKLTSWSPWADRDETMLLEVIQAAINAQRTDDIVDVFQNAWFRHDREKVRASLLITKGYFRTGRHTEFEKFKKVSIETIDGLKSYGLDSDERNLHCLCDSAKAFYDMEQKQEGHSLLKRAVALMHKVLAQGVFASQAYLHFVAETALKMGDLQLCVQITRSLPDWHGDDAPRIVTHMIESGDRRVFKPLLAFCASNLRSAWLVCGALATAYPDQAEALLEVAREYSQRSTSLSCDDDCGVVVPTDLIQGTEIKTTEQLACEESLSGATAVSDVSSIDVAERLTLLAIAFRDCRCDDEHAPLVHRAFGLFAASKELSDANTPLERRTRVRRSVVTLARELNSLGWTVQAESLIKMIISGVIAGEEVTRRMSAVICECVTTLLEKATRVGSTNPTFILGAPEDGRQEVGVPQDAELCLEDLICLAESTIRLPISEAEFRQLDNLIARTHRYGEHLAAIGKPDHSTMLMHCALALTAKRYGESKVLAELETHAHSESTAQPHKQDGDEDEAESCDEHDDHGEAKRIVPYSQELREIGRNATLFLVQRCIKYYQPSLDVVDVIRVPLQETVSAVSALMQAKEEEVAQEGKRLTRRIQKATDACTALKKAAAREMDMDRALAIHGVVKYLGAMSEALRAVAASSSDRLVEHAVIAIQGFVAVSLKRTGFEDDLSRIVKVCGAAGDSDVSFEQLSHALSIPAEPVSDE